MSKVLIIDDDASMQSLFQRVFTLEGFQVEIATGGAEGLEKAQSLHPDIILLDMMMPKVNGLEVLEKLKADPITDPIPVIVMSNYSELNLTTRATQLGAAQYLVKSDIDPTSAVELAQTVLNKSKSN